MKQKNILEYLEKTVKTYPEKVAFVDKDNQITFKDIYNTSLKIGTALAMKGYYKEPVMIFMPKCTSMITSFFGTIYSGNYYVPIDSEMGEFRINLIFEKISPRVVICDKETSKKLLDKDYKGEILVYEDIIKTVINKICLDNIRSKQVDIDPLYVVFTSGSTGNPKGVTACHRSVIDYIENLSEILEFNENTIFANQTPLYLDACLKEVISTIKCGATTYIVPKHLFLFPIKLVEYLNENKINTVCWVTSALTNISSLNTFEKLIPKYLHTIAFGSEVFPIKELNRWIDALPNAKFTNLYGPTETTGMCCYYHITKKFKLDEVVPIGKPFNNREIILLDEKNKLVQEGEIGEICIRGTNLTFGYYKDFDKTNEVFIQNPLNENYPELIYKTGDLGRINKNGELLFVSRKDHQIKHLGHRIELDEIENVANQNEEVIASCCLYDKNKKSIVLYYIGEVEELDLQMKLKELLPRYMIPRKIIRKMDFPYTANGKLDRLKIKNEYESNCI